MVLARAAREALRLDRDPARSRLACVSVAMPGETVCGDAWHVRQYPNGAVVLVADGLGPRRLCQRGLGSCGRWHSSASRSDARPLARWSPFTTRIRHTRGAAAAIADVEPGSRRRALHRRRQHRRRRRASKAHVRQAVSINGTLGHQARHFREYLYPWAADGVLVMHSDGLSGRTGRSIDYPGLRQRAPALIAAILYRDFQPVAGRCDRARREGGRMNGRLLSVRIRQEHDVVAARQRARQIAAALGFDATEQTRIATAVSELARNVFMYAGGGVVEFGVEGDAPPQLLVDHASATRAQASPNLADVLDGQVPVVDRHGHRHHRHPPADGLLRRAIDAAAGTTVTRQEAAAAPDARRSVARRARARGRRARSRSGRPGRSTRSSSRTRNCCARSTTLRARQDELERVNRELEDTNRGVVALYAELDERADHLRRADELKTRFLSNMTHEFRTPVNSILALTTLLADRLARRRSRRTRSSTSGKSAQQLSDSSTTCSTSPRSKPGKIEVRPAPFEVASLFGALRGMLRPLLVNQSLALVFEEPDDLPPIFSDESKISQILRNFISNALKYTERGEVRVSARLTPSARCRRVRRRRHRHRHPAKKTSAASSKSSSRSRTRCSGASRAPGSVCRSRSGSPSCSAGASSVVEHARRRARRSPPRSR